MCLQLAKQKKTKIEKVLKASEFEFQYWEQSWMGEDEWKIYVNIYLIRIDGIPWKSFYKQKQTSKKFNWWKTKTPKTEETPWEKQN